MNLTGNDPDAFPIGTFACGLNDFAEKLRRVRALVFDWDGVFNRGEKTSASHSGFSEADSMGINLLRFGFWLRDEGRLPIATIISGATNEMAEFFARREHFHAVMTGIKQKDAALRELAGRFGFTVDQAVFFFDDIIDLQAAGLAGLRVFFSHPATPLTIHFVKSNNLFDYIPLNEAGNLGVREVCELMLHCMGMFEEVVRHRMQFSESYQKYLAQRDAIEL